MDEEVLSMTADTILFLHHALAISPYVVYGLNYCISGGLGSGRRLFLFLQKFGLRTLADGHQLFMSFENRRIEQLSENNIINIINHLVR